jgi:hypothetical protein
VIKTKQFNGSGGSGYWNNKFLDIKGRVILEENFKKKELLAVYAHRYDELDNMILSITVYDINNLKGDDEFRINKFSYKYDDNGRVVEKKSAIGNSFSSKKIQKQIDSNTFEIIEVHQNYLKEEERIDTTETIIMLDHEGKLLKKIQNSFEDDGTNTTHFQYYKNGNLKRRIIERNPKPKVEIVYTGWPGSDDMTWQYEYDKKGRVLRLYSIVEGKKYKLEEYEYKER